MQLGLAHGEIDVDRVARVQRVEQGLLRRNQSARLDQGFADESFPRSANHGEPKIELGRAHQCLLRFHTGLTRLLCGHGRVVILPAHEFPVEEELRAFQPLPGVDQGGLRLGKIRLRLRKCRFEGTWIDLVEQLALLYVRAVGERQALEQTRHLSANFDDVLRIGLPYVLVVYRHRARADFLHCNFERRGSLVLRRLLRAGRAQLPVQTGADQGGDGNRS